jgi:Fe-S-cluster-containing hydrogenase component 2
MSKSDGLVSLEEIKKCPGWPDKNYIDTKRVAVLECVEDIPCNPCETACPHGAITVGEPIINLPVIHAEKCTGCNLCIAACPWLAIFVVEKNYNDQYAALSLPYEFLPIPEKGQTVKTYDREGACIGEATIVKVAKLKKYDKTCVVTVTFEKELLDTVRSIRIL